MSTKPSTLSQFIDRARQGQAQTLLYWLSFGGWKPGDNPDQPGRPIDVPNELAALKKERPDVYAAYMAALKQLGLTLEQLPKVACDCSGYVTWALKEPRKNATLHDGWINTDSIVADANGAQRLFVPAKRVKPGVLLVHPKPGGSSDAPGHVGIVTEVNVEGKAVRMLHSAPENFLLPPAPERERTAIQETGTELFQAIKSTQVVVWKAFAAEVNHP